MLANRASLAAGLHGVRQIGWLAQVHGTKVHEFGLAEQEQTPPTADAAACTSPGMALAILTADCLPVLLCRRDGRAVGAAHAGWRGLLAGVIENTAQRLGSGVELMAWLGPAAGPERYEVGAEVREAFVAVDAQVQDCFKPSRPGHFLMDMYALARMRLQHIGVNAVYGGGLCTIGDADRFYSYRRHAQTGRMASLIWIESEQAKPV